MNELHRLQYSHSVQMFVRTHKKDPCNSALGKISSYSVFLSFKLLVVSCSRPPRFLCFLFFFPLFVYSLAFLVKEGYEDKIVVAHDIHTKNRLTKFGGHGYSHILKNIVPKMLMRGISQHQVDKILIDNPKHWLTFK